MRTARWDPAHPPFSFVFAGQSSAEFLPQWSCESTAEAIAGGTLTHYRYTDPAGRLTVTAHVRAFADFPALDWVLEFSNAGSEDTPIIADILSLDTTWQQAEGAQVLLHHAKGSLCLLDDFLPLTDALPVGKTLSLAPMGGRSSNGTLPFMNLQGQGGGVTLAVGWSGQWAAHFDRDNAGLRLRAGMERTHLCLHPGETIRTPRMLLIDWTGDAPAAGQNLLRQLILAHYTPRVDGEIAIPPVAHMTMSTYHHTRTTSEENELDALAHARALGAEAFWIDACWYGASGYWWKDVGDWTVYPGRFPHGLKPIGDAARAAGMQFVLWFEPERVFEGTPLTIEHPEFLTELPDTPNQLFNLGLPEARRYMTDTISRVIEESGVTIYRQDFNFEPLPYWQAMDAPDRIGMAEIRHIEGLYAMWDALRQRHPGLTIDNCASGGRRIDLETTARSFPLWRSDFSDVGGPSYGYGLQIGDQLQTAGLSRWVPLHAAAVW
ncbi:MAG TPA: glycoside hydrolase family 36 protein, partial [Armatimonadota bacterium]